MILRRWGRRSSINTKVIRNKGSSWYVSTIKDRTRRTDRSLLQTLLLWFYLPVSGTTFIHPSRSGHQDLCGRFHVLCMGLCHPSCLQTFFLPFHPCRTFQVLQFSQFSLLRNPFSSSAFAPSATVKLIFSGARSLMDQPRQIDLWNTAAMYVPNKKQGRIHEQVQYIS